MKEIITILILFTIFVEPLNGQERDFFDVQTSKKYISDCANRSYEGTVIKVRMTNCFPCNTNIITYSDVFYDLQVIGNRIIISTKIRFMYTGNQSILSDETFESIVEDNIKLIKDIYAQNGLEIDIQFVFDRTSGSDDLDQEFLPVFLSDQINRMNETQWAWFTIDGEKTTKTWAHELGHVLGLEDTYYDPDCPLRSYLGPGNDLMSGHSVKPKALRLYPWEVAKILEPLCGKPPYEVAKRPSINHGAKTLAEHPSTSHYKNQYNEKERSEIYIKACDKILKRYPNCIADDIYNHTIHEIEEKFPGITKMCDELGIGVFDTRLCF